MLWALRWTCSPAGNTQGQALAPAAPRPLRRQEQPKGRTKFRDFFAKRGHRGAAPSGAAHPPPAPCRSRGFSSPVNCPPLGTAGVISMLSPKQSGPLRPRDEGAGPSRQARFAVSPFPRKRGSTLKWLLGKKPGGVTGGKRGLSSRTEQRG